MKKKTTLQIFLKCQVFFRGSLLWFGYTISITLFESHQLHVLSLLILPALQPDTFLLAFRAYQMQSRILDVKSRRLPCRSKAVRREAVLVNSLHPNKLCFWGQIQMAAHMISLFRRGGSTQAAACMILCCMGQVTRRVSYKTADNCQSS